MKWSLKISTFFGIPVYLHLTFLLLLGWIGFREWAREGSLAQALGGMVFLSVIFLCVVLHEFGHALAARRFGIRTRDVILLPIGGVARLERMPDEPRQELWVALAGPAVNVGIAALLGLWLALRGALAELAGVGVVEGSFAARLLAVNLVLVAFNMLPAFPMDGGRVLRALLATRLDPTRATAIAARIGQTFALLFALAGLFVNPFLLLIALFVWFGAGQEAAMQRTRSTADGTPISQAMLTDFETLAPSDPLSRAVELTLDGSQRDFPVVAGGQPVGILRQEDLLTGLSRSGPSGDVGQAMRRDYQPVELSDQVVAVLSRLQTGAARTLPVARHGRLVGLVTLQNIREYLAIHEALNKPRPMAAAPSRD